MGVERGHRAWQVHVDGHLDPATLATDLAAVADGGGGSVFVWVSEPTDEDDRIAADAGLATGRDLLQLRIPLPAAPTSLAWRPFVPGRDDAAWVSVNNRAFHWHPEQGGWTVELLRERMAEPWFDPEGFLVHERDDRMAGFCWTKVHTDPERLGEIYVIAVDPDFHGAGLGKALTLAGLDWLHRARDLDVGMLYVDESNTSAVALYRRLGFTTHTRDRAYAAEIEASGGGG